MILHFNLKKLIISLIIPLITGGMSALLVRDSMNIYDSIKSPPLSPPGWLFPIVWTVLYILMGISLYLVWNSDASANSQKTAFAIFGIQLFLNFIWSPVFFNARQFLLASIIVSIMWILVLAMIVVFYKISKPAGLLQIPYLIWLTIATYLSISVYILNR